MSSTLKPIRCRSGPLAPEQTTTQMAKYMNHLFSIPSPLWNTNREKENICHHLDLVCGCFQPWRCSAEMMIMLMKEVCNEGMDFCFLSFAFALNPKLCLIASGCQEMKSPDGVGVHMYNITTLKHNRELLALDQRQTLFMIYLHFGMLKECKKHTLCFCLLLFPCWKIGLYNLPIRRINF